MDKTRDAGPTGHIEVIARAVAGEDVRDIGLCPVHWDTAESITTALTNAGMVIVPKEATAAMGLAGVIEIVNAIGSGGRKPLRTDIAANVYRAMIDAG